MVAVFFLRLATGMLGALVVVWGQPIHQRFFRTHFLTAFGLVTGASLLFPQPFIPWPLWAAMLLCLLGAISWSLELAPGGRLLIVVTATLLALILFAVSLKQRPWNPPPEIQEDFVLVQTGPTLQPSMVADDLTAAAVLGSALTVMLLGHFYLISAGLSITPLMRLLGLLGLSLILRLGVALLGLWQWTGSPGGDRLDSEMLVWLGVRWGVGIFIPLVLTWLAYETARIRSTQSATGILYVVVICCFLGELTALLLLGKTGTPL